MECGRGLSCFNGEANAFFENEAVEPMAVPA
jgi:hypothetical protein